MTGKRLLLLAPASVIHTTKWANGLAEKGFNVHLVTQHEPTEPLDSKVNLHLLPFKGMKGYFLNAKALSRLERSIGPDVTSVHYATGYGVLAMMARLKSYILSVWGSDVYVFPYKSWLHLCLVRKSLRSAKAIASTSEAMADQVRTVLNDSKQHIHITPFGVNMRRFSPSRAAFDDNTITIGTVKGLEDVYGIDVLLKAYKALITDSRAAGKSFRLVIAGEGSKKEQLKILSAELGIQAHTDFLGRVPNQSVTDVINSFDLFMVCSRVESFGVAAVEASACERVCIVSNTGGLPEIIQHQKTGFLVDVDDVDGFKESMWLAIENKDVSKRYAKAARRLVEKRYSEDAVMNTMAKVLSDNMEAQK